MTPKQISALWNSFLLLLLFLGYNLLGSFFSLALQIGQTLGKGKPIDFANLQPDGKSICIAMIIAAVFTIVVLRLITLIHKPWIKPAPNGVLRSWGWGIVAFSLVALGTNFICSPLNLSDMGTESLFREIVSNIGGICLIIFLGPLIEELVFRAGILRQLLNGGFSPTVAVVCAGVLFGGAHMNWAQAIPATVLGIMLGLLYIKAGDIRLSLLAHILNNTMGVISLLTLKPGQEVINVPLWGEILIGIAVTAIGVVLVRYWWNQSRPTIHTTE
ncbi:MAG: CPBP family intramembrane metalloprotease [Alloprevotella sp.]|nr:CPBP family intramembrane metalloprotease [Alloprevotella sp.]